MADKTLVQFRRTATEIEKTPWMMLDAASYLRSLCDSNESGTWPRPPDLYFLGTGPQRLQEKKSKPMSSKGSQDFFWQDFAPGTPKKVVIHRAPMVPDAAEDSEDDIIADLALPKAAAQPKPKPKAQGKATSQAKSKAKAKAKAKALPAPAEPPQAAELLQEVAALPDLPAPVPAPVVLPADVDEEPAQQPPEKVYAPRKFQQAQIQYVKEQTKTGVSRKDALKMWMLSTERADLLNSLPESELKKRRFM